MKAPQAEAVSVLTSSGATGSVGPTSPAGWTAAWVEVLADRDLVLPGPATFLTIEDLPPGPQLVLRDGDGTETTLSWPHHGNDELTGAVARRLATLFAVPDRADHLEELLSASDHDADSLTTELEDIVDLPELMEKNPHAAAVFTRSETAVVRLASAIAGPTWLIDPGNGWTVAQSADGKEDADFANAELAAAISAAGSRRDRALLLWRDGAASGFTIWRRGAVDAGWSWNSRWREIEDDEMVLAKETACVTGLAALAGDDLHLPSLRALLRRGDRAEDPLTELATLIGMPSPALTVLDQSGMPRDGLQAELVKGTTPVSAWWTAVRHPRPRPVRGWLRPFYIAYAVGTILAAVAATALAIIGIGVLATGGSLVDEPQLTSEDWLFTGFLALLSLVLIPTAVFRVRRLRATDDTESEEGSPSP